MDIFDDDYKKGSENFKNASKELVEAYKKYQGLLVEKSVFGPKITELMLLAASCAIQCSYCIATHSARAKAAGATPEEMAQVIHLAASVKHGATVSYGVNSMSD